MSTMGVSEPLLYEASAEAAAEDDFGAVFVCGDPRGWVPGSFRLFRPKEAIVVTEETAFASKDFPFGALESAIASNPNLVWAGFISYDAGRFVENIPSIAQRDRNIPLVVFAGFDGVEPVQVYDKGQSLCDHLAMSRKEASVPDADFSYREALREKKAHPSGVVASDAHLSGLDDLHGRWEESLSKKEYEKAVEAALEHIKAGEFYQVNLARRVSSLCTASPRLEAIRAFELVCKALRPPRGSFFAWEENFVVSASPELFLCWQGRRITTKPIKGTRPRRTEDVPRTSDPAITELRKSSKDRAENVMIVDLLRNDLGKVSEYGSVRVPVLFDVETYPAVHHLVSTVTATLRPETSLAQLLRATFPGGSITGAPKPAAMKFIESVEKVRRGVYTGAIGYIDPSNRLPRELGVNESAPFMELAIAIRTLVLTGGRWDLWVGGGIVSDSNPELEWQETVHKSRGLASVL